MSEAHQFIHEKMDKDVYDLTLEYWYQTWWKIEPTGPQVVPEILPQDGVMTHLYAPNEPLMPVVASFLYNTPGVALSIHGYLVTNPDIDPSLRQAAVEAHIPAAQARAEELGCNYQYWLAHEDSFVRRLIRNHGFEPALTKCSAAYHISGSGPKLAALEA
jgi:hypothetical protein